MSDENLAGHWAKTKRLTFTVLVIWAFFSFVIHIWANELNSITFIGFPLGYYMGAQGSLIAFVLLIWYLAKKQDSIDREFGVAEDD